MDGTLLPQRHIVYFMGDRLLPHGEWIQYSRKASCPGPDSWLFLFVVPLSVPVGDRAGKTFFGAHTALMSSENPMEQRRRSWLLPVQSQGGHSKAQGPPVASRRACCRLLHGDQPQPSEWPHLPHAPFSVWMSTSWTDSGSCPWGMMWQQLDRTSPQNSSLLPEFPL